MSLLTIKAEVSPESVSEVEAAVKEMFSAIEREAPENVRYASCRLADSAIFLIILEIEDGTDNPLPRIPEFQRFQEQLGGWMTGPPEIGPAEIVGSYRLF